jgi:hypothetical protein
MVRFKGMWLAISLFVSVQAIGIEQTQQADDIKVQLMRIQSIQKDTGIRLSGNPEFHDWIMENSRQ